MITIVDSGIANVGSVLAACRRAGVEARVSCDASAVLESSGIILPGVGSFADGMESLRRHGLIRPLQKAARAGRPILGICLGMQLLADSSEEFGVHQGLGLVPGSVRLLAPALPGERVPNIGWCDVRFSPRSRLFLGVGEVTPFYFVHSYHLVCTDTEDCAGTIFYGRADVCVAVERGNVWGTQFHPEKSQDAGMEVLVNFSRHAQR